MFNFSINPTQSTLRAVNKSSKKREIELHLSPKNKTRKTTPNRAMLASLPPSLFVLSMSKSGAFYER
jgi:hypothetical protein